MKDMREEIVEGVIEQNAVRLYRARVVLLESNDDIVFARAKIEYLNPLPVLDDTGRAIGGATISYDGCRVVADLVFDYASPERLDLENDLPIYAEPVGMIWPAVEPLTFAQFGERSATLNVSRVKLTGIVLTNMCGAHFSARVCVSGRERLRLGAPA